MAWLLDTHVWVWSQLEPAKMGPRTSALLGDATQALYVATISTLEIARLVVGGQIELTVSVDEWTEASSRELCLATLELTHAIAALAYQLPEPFHRDPADRILVATARQNDLTLVTADRRILEYPHVRSHDATT